MLTTERISHHTSLPKLKETRGSSKRVAYILFHHRKPANVHDFHNGGTSALAYAWFYCYEARSEKPIADFIFTGGSRKLAYFSDEMVLQTL